LICRGSHDAWCPPLFPLFGQSVMKQADAAKDIDAKITRTWLTSMLFFETIVTCLNLENSK
jgi:hypothetical protein